MQESPNQPVTQPRTTPPAGQQTGQGESRASAAMDTVQEHTKEVASHAAEEARGVVDQAVDRLREQAEQQTGQVQQALARTGSQLEALAEGRVEDAGQVADYARRAADRVQDLANRLDRLGFDGVMSEVSGYARRRPGRFLLATAGAGLVVGRLGRNARALQNGSAQSPAERKPPAGQLPHGTGTVTSGPTVAGGQPRYAGGELRG